ncbi:hypothetical protein KSX_03450 [Ktedonospora formicarum]|uniref:Adenine deaminase C-terminal domain-containing protein n=1 Tax=Ktedonospora formicarum TaxID=2778364 RepID=A0A8J3HQX1_9CHLR|nr:hypothetical protein KSX_03450 [Ktedonospora formicarum]
MIVANGEIIATLPLPLGGIISPQPVEEVARDLEYLDQTVSEMGVKIAHPFGFLSFLALSIVPSLKITDLGVLNVDTWSIIPVQ